MSTENTDAMAARVLVTWFGGVAAGGSCMLKRPDNGSVPRAAKTAQKRLDMSGAHRLTIPQIGFVFIWWLDFDEIISTDR